MVLVSDIGIIPLYVFDCIYLIRKSGGIQFRLRYFRRILARFSSAFAIGFVARKDLKITVDN